MCEMKWKIVYIATTTIDDNTDADVDKTKICFLMKRFIEIPWGCKQEFS